MKKNKKVLYISLLGVDVSITIFLFIVSIVMLATMPSALQLKIMREQNVEPENFIQFFQINTNVYLFVGVLPLFVLLAVNVWLLIRFVKKSNEKKKVALNELSAEQKEALRQELLKDLNNKQE